MKRFLFIIYLLACHSAHAQFDLEHLNKSWDAAEESEFYLLFKNKNIKQSSCPFTFNKGIEAPDGLELSLAPFLEVNGLEDRCMRGIHHSNCERHENIMQMADLYLPLIEQHLKTVKLDVDLAFLPMVLSGFNSIYNESNGQAGLWALSYADAVKGGLLINSNLDERLGADPSTKTAVNLLKSYYQEFNSDYIMTIAAYVKGSRWTRSRSKEQITTDPEMAEFFCSLKICIRLYKNFERENQLRNWLEFLNKYDVVGSIDTLSIQAIIKTLDLDTEEITALNPVLVGYHLPAKYRTVPLLLPRSKTDLFNQKQDEIKQYKATVKPIVIQNTPSGNEQYYRVQSGDVLGVIAEKLNTRVSLLRSWNNLRGDRIYAGQKLVYYSSNSPKPTTLAKASPVLSTEWVSYTVKPGESLWLIAKKFKGVSADNIMEWTSIDNNIKPGQVIKIYNQ